MKKITLLVVCATMIACNKNANTTAETKNTSVLWASNVETMLPMIQDTMWSKENWDEVYKYDKKTIFETMKNAVVSGKLKAYTAYPAGEMSVEEFKTRMADITADKIAQMRFDESMELDTANYTINKKVAFVTFTINKLADDGQIMGMAKLCDIKMNTALVAKKE